MKFQIPTILAAASVALADYNVTLVTESSHDDVNGKSLIPFHEGAGINFLFLADSAPTNEGSLEYSPETNSVYLPIPVGTSDGTDVQKWNLTVFPEYNAISVGVIPGTPILVDNSYLTINGSTTFYAGKFTGDAYSYSNTSYELLASKASNAYPVKVKIVPSSNSTNGTFSSASASSNVPVASATSSVPIANGAASTGLGSAAAAIAGAILLL